MDREKLDRANALMQEIEDLEDMQRQTEDKRGFSLIAGEDPLHGKMVYFENGTKEHLEMKHKIESRLLQLRKEFDSL